MPTGKAVSLEGLIPLKPLQKSNYAYAIKGNDYNIPALTYYLQENDITVSTAFKGFETASQESYSYGSLVIPVASQKKSAEEIFAVLTEAQVKFKIQINSLSTGFSSKGIDVGSRYIRPLEKPKAIMLIGDGVRSYEAGEVWHLLDTRVGMPITKVRKNYFDRVELEQYNTLVLVSGTYKWLSLIHI